MKNAQNAMHYNSAKITGRMISSLTPCPTSGRVKLYQGMMEVERLSGTIDYIPVVVHEKLAETLPKLLGELVEVIGQISTCNRAIDGKTRLIVDLYAYSINVIKDAPHGNEVVLRGTVCKDPIFRVTPKGREICDLMLAVSRPNGRASYIPCVIWGREAREARSVNIGDVLEVHGRFQSRVYDKQYEDGTVESRTTYEVSVAKVVMEAK